MRFNGLNTDRLETMIRRLLGIRQGGILPSLSPEVAVEVGLPHTMDLLALSDSWSWGTGASQGAVAAEQGAVVFTNNSSQLLFCINFEMHPAATAVCTLVRGSAALTLPLTVLDAPAISWRDTRRPADSFPITQISISSGSIPAGVPANTFRCARQRVLANETMRFPEVVVAPGDSVMMYCELVNTALWWQAYGTVRAALQDELAAS